VSTNPQIREAVVEVDITTLDMSSSGVIAGVVAINTGSSVFPEQNWSDFPVIVLSGWLDSVPGVSNGMLSSWECTFMDGPLSIRLRQQSGDTWSLICLRNDQVQHTERISRDAFIRSLILAARAVAGECYRREWRTPDVEALNSQLKRAEHCVAQCQDS
jgi:hypothetical protein